MAISLFSVGMHYSSMYTAFKRIDQELKTLELLISRSILDFLFFVNLPINLILSMYPQKYI